MEFLSHLHRYQPWYGQFMVIWGMWSVLHPCKAQYWPNQICSCQYNICRGLLNNNIVHLATLYDRGLEHTLPIFSKHNLISKVPSQAKPNPNQMQTSRLKSICLIHLFQELQGWINIVHWLHLIIILTKLSCKEIIWTVWCLKSAFFIWMPNPAANPNKVAFHVTKEFAAMCCY